MNPPQHGPIARLTAVGGLLLLAAVPLLAGPVLYVDDDAPFGGDGQSWQTAFRFLQDALAAAEPGSDVEEVRVAQGTYLPDRDEEHPEGTGDREATFQLIDDVSLMGGYAGIGAEDPDERDIDLYETILSGDLLGNDLPGFINYDDNSFHVVTGSACDATAVLDGFIIRAGNAITGTMVHMSGGGVHNQQGSPTVNSCAFRENAAAMWGGAMFNYDHSNPTVTGCAFSQNVSGSFGGAICNDRYCDTFVGKCVFLDNVAGDGGGGLNDGFQCSAIIEDCTFIANTALGPWGGGAICCDISKDLHIARCMFIDNHSEFPGGAVYAHGGPGSLLTECLFADNVSQSEGGAVACVIFQGTIQSCAFHGNTAGLEGGGLFGWSCFEVPVVNCLFDGNAAGGNGGGMCIHSTPIVRATNCTFAFNSAGEGIGGGATGGETYADCVFWSNTPSQIDGVEAVTYSCVEGGYEGEGNIDADPLFVDPDGPDNDPNTWEDNDYRLGAGSPCIDAGDNTAVPPDEFDMDEDGDTEEPLPFDLDGNPRFVDDPDTEDTGHGEPPIVDMGAYEFQPPECPADFNGDGLVNTADLLILLGAWGTAGPDGDVDGDGHVDTSDLLALLAAWGECP